MQGDVSIRETLLSSTVAKAMEKRREIPGTQTTKNLASRVDIERVLNLMGDLGYGTESGFVEHLGRSRATFYRLKKYDVTVSMLREIEEELVREAQRRNHNVAPTRSEQDELLAVWRDLGEQLLLADPSRFASTLDGLRDMVESAQLQQRAIHKMFRATPDPTRK